MISNKEMEIKKSFFLTQPIKKKTFLGQRKLKQTIINYKLEKYNSTNDKNNL